MELKKLNRLCLWASMPFDIIPGFSAKIESWFFYFLLRGYARSFFHKLTPYSEKRPELHKIYLYQLFFKKVGAMCGHFTTSDVILLNRL